MAVPGVVCDLVVPASYRGNPNDSHLPVNPFAGAAKSRLEQVIKAVEPQWRIFLV